MSNTFPPDKILKLVQMRRNLRGIINSGNRILEIQIGDPALANGVARVLASANQVMVGIDRFLALLEPVCAGCLNDYGLINSCRKNPTCKPKQVDTVADLA